MKRPSLLDPLFRYIPASTHDASSIAFRRRQQQRLRDAQANAAEAQAKVAPLARKAQAGRITLDGLIVIESVAFAAIALAATWLGYL